MIDYREHVLDGEMLLAMRNKANFRPVTLAMAQSAVQHSFYSIVAFDQNEVVGIGRLAGDGGINLYVQDIIVLPDYQGRGIGREIMRRIMAHIRAHYEGGTTIGLFCARGREGFYENFGFRCRPNEREGPGMMLQI